VILGVAIVAPLSTTGLELLNDALVRQRIQIAVNSTQADSGQTSFDKFVNVICGWMKFDLAHFIQNNSALGRGTNKALGFHTQHSMVIVAISNKVHCP
jgi:hypothetical protein